MKNDKAEKKIRKARVGLILEHPFFGSVALRLLLLEDTQCDTMWTDGVHLGYNPMFIENLSLGVIKAGVAHEVMHIASFHHTRRQNRDHQQWNEAGDLAINGILDNCKFEIPKEWLLDPQYKDKSTEEIYALRYRPPQQKKSEGKLEVGNGLGQGSEKSQEEKMMTFGEVRDYPEKDGSASSEAELRNHEANVKVILSQAIQAGKSAGSLSADLERYVKELLDPKLSWQEILRRFVEQSAKNDYSWFPPNRRYIHQGLYLPSCHSDELGEIVLVVDTSGSIAQKELDAFAAEIGGILEEFPTTTLTVIYCDSQIRNIEEITELPLELHPKGGGGTSFIPPFEWLEKEGREPVCFIYLTDGCCNLYPEEPNFPVLWVGTQDFTPKFGEFVNLI